MAFDLNSFLDDQDPDALASAAEAAGGDDEELSSGSAGSGSAEPEQPSTEILEKFEKRFKGVKSQFKDDEALVAAIEQLAAQGERFREVQPILAEYSEHAESFRKWREEQEKAAKAPPVPQQAEPQKPARPSPPEWEDDWARLVVNDPQTGRLKARFNGVDPAIVRKAEARLKWERENQRRLMADPVDFFKGQGVFDALQESMLKPAITETEKRLMDRITALEQSIQQKNEDKEFNTLRQQRAMQFLQVDEAGRPVFNAAGQPVLNEVGTQFTAVHDMATQVFVRQGVEQRMAERMAWELATNMVDAATAAAAAGKAQPGQAKKQVGAAKPQVGAAKPQVGAAKPQVGQNRIAGAIKNAIKNGASTNPADSPRTDGAGRSNGTDDKKPRNHAKEALAAHKELYGDDELD